MTEYLAITPGATMTAHAGNIASTTITTTPVMWTYTVTEVPILDQLVSAVRDLHAACVELHEAWL